MAEGTGAVAIARSEESVKQARVVAVSVRHISLLCRKDEASVSLQLQPGVLHMDCSCRAPVPEGRGLLEGEEHPTDWRAERLKGTQPEVIRAI